MKKILATLLATSLLSLMTMSVTPAQARPEKAEKPEKKEKPEKAEKPEKKEKPEKAEKPEKPERPGHK